MGLPASRKENTPGWSLRSLTGGVPTQEAEATRADSPYIALRPQFTKAF